MKQTYNNSNENHNCQAEDNFRMTDLNFDDLTLKDAKQIFTELQSHQIELQKQNEELRKKQHVYQCLEYHSRVYRL